VEMLIFLTLLVLIAARYRPVVLLHGLMASNEAMSHLQGWLQQDFPGIYTLNVEIGNGKEDSLWMHMNDQCESLAQQILADPQLRDGFTIVGHSQGGMTSRCAIERYSLPVYNFISLAGPQGGVFGVPDLNALCPDVYCPELLFLFDELLLGKWTDPYVMNAFSFAQYWRDPFLLDEYLEYNTYLADLNNEYTQSKNATYRDNIIALNHLVLIYSTTDTIVVPRQSPWFYFYQADSDTVVQKVQSTPGYQGDWIGLRTLDQQNKVDFIPIPCSHANLPRDVCRPYYEKLYRQYFNTTIAD